MSRRQRIIWDFCTNGDFSAAPIIQTRFHWYRKSADRGFAKGQFHTLWFAMAARAGHPEAIEWAMQNDAAAQLKLGLAYQFLQFCIQAVPPEELGNVQTTIFM